MTRSRDIGEFKGRNFVIATIIFFVFGLVFYSRFDFRVDPKEADELTKQQGEITTLEKRIDILQKSNADLQSELKEIKKQQNVCCKSHGPTTKRCPCQKP